MKNLHFIILDISLGLGIITTSIMRYLRGANEFIGEFGYSVVIVVTVLLCCLKMIDFLFRLVDRRRIAKRFERLNKKDQKL